MPSLELLLAFAVASLVLVVIPGPNVVYIVARGVAQGRAAAVASTLGVEAGMLVHITAAATGLSALVTRTALTFTMVKVAGAVYLLALAVRALRTGDGSRGSRPPREERRPGRLFLQGFWVSVLNPKVAVFFLAFLPQFVRPVQGSVLAQTLVLGGVFLAIATASDLVYAVVSGAAGERVVRVVRGRPRRRYVEAAVYAGLGLTVLTTGAGDP